MAVKTTLLEPVAANGTVTLGASGDTISIPSGVTLANSGTATGFGGGGKVLQVVTDMYNTETGTTSTSYVAVSGFAATITPSSTSSKILVLCSASSYINAADHYLGTIYRGATDLGTFGRIYSAAGGIGGFISFNYLDSPSTTSATTYTYYHKVGAGTGYVSVNNYKSNLTLMEIAV
tara:strand:- start:18208 stop:18738 length:531 start_codon:yes stop_codon:yes gene_type:complete